MSEFFLQMVNMSISASWIVLVVLLLRLLLKGAPKWITVLLWGIVAVRLVCPFSIESVLSLIPSAQTISPQIMMDATPEITSGTPVINDTLNPTISESLPLQTAQSVNPLQVIMPIISYVWIIGVVGLLVYVCASYFRLKRRVSTAVVIRDNIYQSESVVSPFVLGIIKPKIYLPFNMDKQQMEYVIAHEQAHICRKDHLLKLFGFILLAVYWFNPLIWLGYILLCRDIEFACDEKVIGGFSNEQRAEYSQALLTASVSRRTIAAYPLAFGEVGVKNRVKSVLNYKKPAFWVVLVAVVLCVAVAVCFLTNPKTPAENINPTAQIHTEYEGVYLTLESIETNSEGYKVLNTVWHNDTDKELMFGEGYAIEYKDNGEWSDVRTTEIIVTSIGYGLMPHSSSEKAYNTKYYDISKSGTYRLCSQYSIGDGKEYTKYTTWIEFEIDGESKTKLSGDTASKNSVSSAETNLPLKSDTNSKVEKNDSKKNDSKSKTEVSSKATTPKAFNAKGVYLTLESVNKYSSGYRILEVVWHNETNRDITYGEEYSIEYKDGTKWKNVSTSQLEFILLGYILPPNSTAKKYYTTKYFDVSKSGTYRLCSSFTAGDSKEYSVQIEFNLDNTKVEDTTNTNVNDASLEGVYWTAEVVTKSNGKKDFAIVWHNETDRYISFSKYYAIEFKNGKNWKNFATNSLWDYDAEGQVKPQSTFNRNYYYGDASKNGVYRLRNSFSIYSEKDWGTGINGSEHSVWMEFEVDGEAITIVGSGID